MAGEQRGGTVYSGLVVIAATVLMMALTSQAQAQRVIVLEDEVIEAEVETPQAFLVLSPSALEYRFRAPVDSFLDALESTLDDAPF